MSEHEWDGSIQSHTVVQLVLKHVKVIETVWLPAAGKVKQQKNDVMITSLITCNTDSLHCWF